MVNLSILAIFKNETMNIVEWMEHYIWQGVDKFHLIDNDSDDDPLRLLQPYIDSGIVSYYERPEKYAQIKHYQSVYQEARLNETTKWLIVADLDEFWYSNVPNQKLSTTLNESFDQYDVIYTGWRMFGSSGLDKHPESIRRSMVHSYPEISKTTKWIIKPAVVPAERFGVHYINEDYLYRKTYDDCKLRLNHYCLQSREFFEKSKMARGDVNLEIYENVRNWGYFNEYNKLATVLDYTLKNLLN